MKIVYEAFDGKTFADEEECLNHEFDCIGDDLQLFDKDGIATNDIAKAHVVYIQSEAAYELFCNLEHLHCPNRDGNFAGFGINIFSKFKNEWVLIPDNCLKGLNTLFEVLK